MFKECKVVMLPTNKATQIIKLNTGSFLQSYKEPTKANKENYTNQNLYILSDDEIKEGEWYIDDINQVRKSITSNKDFWNRRTDYKKIIASTDKSLCKPSGEMYPEWDYLTQIPEWFIKEYCNKGGIDTVLVEYVFVGGINGQFKSCIVRPSDNNTVTIQLIKDNYSREEVEELLHKYADDLIKGTFRKNKRVYLNEWIKENL